MIKGNLMLNPPFNSVWLQIVKYAGQQFRTATGLPFTYAVKGQVLRPSRTHYNLTRSELAKAYALMPLKGPGQINSIVRGPAYVYAILMDSRITGAPLLSTNKDPMGSESTGGKPS